ncbi:MAG TPA: CPBP family intramembrane metalloprotease, partial [Myxococcota bacterium]|nr:CPBP family intramembrane metalloprotease [Myxococcota bacterium]
DDIWKAVQDQYKAELEAIQICAARLVKEEQRRRLDALGIPDDPTKLVQVVTSAEDAPAPSRAPEPFGLALVSFLSLSALTWAYEALPGARQRGWLESLSAAPTSPQVVVGGYVAVCTLWALLNGLIFCLGGLLNGVEVDPRWLLMPVMAATVAALSVRTFLPMPDLRSSSLRTAWVPMAALALGGLAILLERRWGLGGLVPYGGMILTWFGGETLSMLLGVAMGIVVILLCIRSGAALLARDALGQGADPTDARRAAGRYAPEALLLFLLALAGGSMAIVPIGAGPVFRLVSGQLCFQLLPALLTPALLGLPFRSLLSLQLPPRRAWAAAPVVMAGTLSAGLLATSLQTALLPDNPFATLDYGAGMESLQAGWGLLFLTLGAGLCEELLFRGAILGLLRRAGSPTVA